MKLKQKLKGLKKIPQILLLSAVTSTISSGCSTTQPWKTVGRESVPTGVTKNYIEKTERETMNLKELKISDIKLDKDMKISVSESLDRKDYIIEYPITEKEVQEFLIEQRRISTTAPGGAIAGTLLGIIGGVYLGDLIESDPEKKFGVILTGWTFE